MRLLVVEDDVAIASSLQRALGRSGHKVDLSGDGHSALLALTTSRYDCIILDLGLPDIDGTEMLRQLRRRKDQTPVVILTARDDTADRVQGLDLGADDYVVKPFELDELEARIRSVTRRSIAGHGADLSLGGLRLAMGDRRFHLQEKPLDLTVREFAVLECLFLRHGRVISKRQLMDAVGGFEMELSENAIELYVHRVRRKIEQSGCRIQTLRGFGYLLQVDEIH